MFRHNNELQGVNTANKCWANLFKVKENHT